MYLLKCKCGSVFTIKCNNTEYPEYIKCPNCGISTSVNASIECRDLKHRLDSIGMTLQVIPDDAKITVSFEA